MSFREADDKLHKAEKTMIEFANIHVETDSIYKAAAERILLTVTSSTLFAANVGYHKKCYDNFRSPKWRKAETNTIKGKGGERHDVDELINIIEYLILLKREVYTLSQLRELYAEIKGVRPESLRSIDIKKIIEEKLVDKVRFCKPTTSAPNTTEYVVSADANTLPDAINAIITGEGITNYIQMKSISRSISEDIQSYAKIAWPPTPQAIIETNEVLNQRLYNIVAWTVSPNCHMGKEGFVKLPKGKATKVSEIVQNIQALVPGAQPSINQILLSLNMYAKTGSKSVVNDLRHLGHGLSYTETMFIQDKWAEWTENQHSIIPSNMKKGVITTHVFDNIDWKNKNVNRVETHHTNSILIQKYDLVDNFSNVRLHANYDFERKSHRSYKGSGTTLPAVYFKRGSVKHLSYTPSDSRVECEKSSLKTLAWVEARMTHNELDQTVPAWGGFQELTTPSDLDQITVGYLPPIPDTPTEMKVIYQAIKRTKDVMLELETDFIFIEADQAIYTKVLDAMFKMKDDGEDLFMKIIPRMGGFHISICMLRTIHGLFKRCGFVQLLSSAGLGGLGTLTKALKGGDVKEAVLLHKKLYEALLRTKIVYIDVTQSAAVVVRNEEEEEKSESIKKLREKVDVDNFQNVLNLIKPLPQVPGDMAWFMQLYLEMVDMLLNYIHFLRTGNYDGYLEIIHEFLIYCFRLNRVNYARNLTYHYVHMMSLKQEHVAAFEYLRNGGFTGSLSGKTHSRIPFDQVIEMTINRSCKDIGGSSCDTQNAGATERWTRKPSHGGNVQAFE